MFEVLTFLVDVDQMTVRFCLGHAHCLFSTIKDFFSRNSSLSQKISHFGFSLFILSILFNGIFAKEFSSNMKVGDERKFINKVIKFENLKIIEKDNYKSLMASPLCFAIFL